jgi:hypothetical protein
VCINLAVGINWELINENDELRYHIRWQTSGECLFDTLIGFPVLHLDISHDVLIFSEKFRTYKGLPDAFAFFYAAFDFIQFDAVAVNLYLRISASDEFIRAVGCETDDIACTVEA